MPKIKMICPDCGSDDVTRDCLGRWSVERQTWEVSSELDNMQCEACDREIGSDGFDEVSVEANTRDIGLAISSFLEGRTFSIHHENDDGGTLDPVADAAIEAIDASDPNNLVLMHRWRTTLHRPHHRRRLTRSFWGLVSAVLSADQGARMPLTRRAREKSDR